MKVNPVYVKYGVIAIVAICFLAVVITVFRSWRKSETLGTEQVIKAKDETIKAIQETRKAWEQVAAEKERNIEQLKKQDSILLDHYFQNQIAYKQLDAKLNKIPDFIQRIANNDDSIRIAFSTFR